MSYAVNLSSSDRRCNCARSPHAMSGGSRSTRPCASPITLLWSVLKTGTADDYLAVRDRFGEPALIDALRRAPPGAIDDRSWQFWHRQFGLPDTPPPRRRFE